MTTEIAVNRLGLHKLIAVAAAEGCRERLGVRTVAGLRADILRNRTKQARRQERRQRSDAERARLAEARGALCRARAEAASPALLPLPPSPEPFGMPPAFSSPAPLRMPETRPPALPPGAWRVSATGCHWLDLSNYTLFAGPTYWGLKRNGFFVVDGLATSIEEAKAEALAAYGQERVLDFDLAPVT